MLLAAASPPSARQGPARDAGAGITFREIKLALAHVGQAGYRGDLVAVQWLGSGFLVDRECTVATALHILDRAKRDELIVRFLHPGDPTAVRTFAAKVVHEDPAKDLVLLRFGGDRYARQFCRSRLKPLRLADAPAADHLTGETVLVAGFPALEEEQPRDPPILRRGIIASAELEWDGAPMLLLDLTGVPGFSGSPVILERTGEVVGIVFGPGRTRRQYDLEWATPISRADYARATEKRAEP